MPDLIEETLADDAVNVLVSFWSTQETVLEEIGEENETGRIFDEIVSGVAYGKGGSRDG